MIKVSITQLIKGYFPGASDKAARQLAEKVLEAYMANVPEARNAAKAPRRKAI